MRADAPDGEHLVAGADEDDSFAIDLSLEYATFFDGFDRRALREIGAGIAIILRTHGDALFLECVAMHALPLDADDREKVFGMTNFLGNQSEKTHPIPDRHRMEIAMHVRLGTMNGSSGYDKLPLRESSVIIPKAESAGIRKSAASADLVILAGDIDNGVEGV